MGPQEVYIQWPEFAEVEYERFRDRLRDLRRAVSLKNNRSASDSAALAHDRLIHPVAAHNHRGEPRWEGSEAQRLLKVDMDNDMHKLMVPEALHHTRQVYMDYPLVVFRKHIEQEERARKLRAQCKVLRDKRN